MAEPRVISAGISNELQAAAAHAESVTLVAPFITRSGMAVVLERLPSKCSVSVITRWRASEVAVGVSDPAIFGAVAERRGRVLLNDALHAKLYLFDEAIAFLGSANLTERGLGVHKFCNVEVMVALAPPPTSVFRLLHALARESIEATEADVTRMLEAAKALPPRPSGDEFRIERAAEPRDVRFPQLRSPERLFELYVTLASALTRDERAQALDDLGVLAVPDGLAKREFVQSVRESLRRHPLVGALDPFLTTRRRFGEIANWLKSVGTYPSHHACQRHAQTLIRWLVYFLPERYRLGQPHYTEVLERVE